MTNKDSLTHISQRCKKPSRKNLEGLQGYLRTMMVQSSSEYIKAVES